MPPPPLLLVIIINMIGSAKPSFLALLLLLLLLLRRLLLHDLSLAFQPVCPSRRSRVSQPDGRQASPERAADETRCAQLPAYLRACPPASQPAKLNNLAASNRLEELLH